MKDFKCIAENSRFSSDEKAHGEDLYRQYLLEFGGATDKAVEATEKALTVKQKIRKLDNLLAAKIYAERLLDMEALTRGNKRYTDAILSFIVPDIPGYRYNSMEYLAESYHYQALSIANSFVFQYRKRGLGQRGEIKNFGKNNIDIYDVITEMEGKIDTGNAKAKEMAKGLKAAFEFLHGLKNRFGAHIAFNEHWLFPQSHSQTILRNLPGEYSEQLNTWREFVKPRLMKDRITSFETGQPVTEFELDLLLEDIFKNIQNGNETRDGSWTKTMSRNRVLQFKDATAFIEYHKKFGEGDLIQTALDHLERQALDIAELQILGPKPQQTLNLLQTKAAEMMRKDGDFNRESLNKMNKKVQAFYDTYKRRQMIPANERWAEFMGSTRNYFTGVFLGSAVLSALPDFANQMRMAMSLGMSKWTPWKIFLKDVMRLGNRQSRATHNQWLIDNGAAIDSYIDGVHRKTKLMEEINGTPLSQMVADGVLRGSLLTGWTDNNRSAAAQTWMQAAARHVGKRWDDIDDVEFKKTYTRYGLDKYWDDVITKAKVDEFEGSKFLSYKHIQKLDHLEHNTFDIATKYLAAERNYLNDAVIVNSVRTRSEMFQATPSGSAAGEVLRSGLMFKSFGVSVYFQHLSQLWREAVEAPQFQRTKHFGREWTSKGARSWNIAKYLTTMTVLGGIAEQLHQLKNGKDPKDMDEPEFLIRAITRGGGLGFMGDIITNSAAGYSLQLFGPLGDLVGDAIGVPGSVTSKLYNGEETELTYDLYQMFRKYTPGQSIWWLQLFYNRMVLENIAEFFDPGIARRLTISARRRESRDNQDYWWRPGDSYPERAPDLGAANLGEALTIGGD